MNEINSDIKPVTNPDEAIEQFVGEQFIEWLMEYVTSQVQGSEELQALANSHPRLENNSEPGFLGFAIANLSESDDSDAESALEILQKKQQEELEGPTLGKPISKQYHKEIWLKLFRALGATEEEITRSEAKEYTRNYIAELSDLYSNGQWQEVAGAFAAHEQMIPLECRVILGLLRDNSTLSDDDLEVLILHSTADTKHLANTAHILEKIVFDEESKRLISEGATRQMRTRLEFLHNLTLHLEN
jgi:hypothetical protein